MEHTLRYWVQQHIMLNWDDHTAVVSHVVEYQDCWLDWLSQNDPTWDCQFVTEMRSLNENTDLEPWVVYMPPWCLHALWGWTSAALEAKHPMAEKVVTFLLHLWTKPSAEITSLLILWWEWSQKHQLDIRKDPLWETLLIQAPEERIITELIYATDTTRPFLYTLWAKQERTLPWLKDTAQWLRTLTIQYPFVIDILSIVPSTEYGWALLHMLHPEESDHWCMAEQIDVLPSTSYDGRFGKTSPLLYAVEE